METIADLPTPTPTLTRYQEAALVRRIEAGALAAAALSGEFPAPDAAPAELALLVREGGDARAELAHRNLALVWYVVNPIALRTGLEADELGQEGFIGMMEAIDTFEPERASFATWALPRIRMRVWDAAATVHGSVGMPARRARQWRRALATASDLMVRLARTPDVAEVARETGEPVATVRQLLAFQPPCTLTDEDAAPWADPMPADGDHLAVRRLLRRLETGDREVLTRLYGLDGAPTMSHVAVARALGRSESTIRRRERIALRLLRAGTPADLAA